MRNRIILFIIGFIIWAILCWPIDIQHALIGILVAAFVTFITADLFSRKVRRLGAIGSYPWFLYYLVVFLWECFKSNIDVALIVLNPRLPISPGIVKIKTSLKSDTALTLLANSITLTPGTFCVDIDVKEGILYIHWIHVRTQDVEQATEMIARKFENILKKIFE